MMKSTIATKLKNQKTIKVANVAMNVKKEFKQSMAQEKMENNYHKKL